MIMLQYLNKKCFGILAKDEQQHRIDSVQFRCLKRLKLCFIRLRLLLVPGGIGICIENVHNRINPRRLKSQKDKSNNMSLAP